VNTAHFAQSVEDVVEESKNLSFSDFRDVVHSLAGIIAYSGIGVGEARKYGRHYLSQKGRHCFLSLGQLMRI
jgi:hypothetical protein